MSGMNHLLIRASAGTGKTYRLSTRYLSLLHGGVKPGDILATTFTRKAAGEVLARVVTRLCRAVTGEEARAELADRLGDAALSRDDCLALLRVLAESMHRLSISTIDGFFNRVAQCFAHELDLPADPVLVDESHPRVKQLRLDAIEAMLGNGDVADLVVLLRQFHHDQAARSVTQALDDIICQTYEVHREAPEREVWNRLDPQGFLDQDALRLAVQALADAAGSLPNHKNWRRAYQGHLQAAIDGQWDVFINTGLTQKLCNDEDTYYGKPIEGRLREALERLIGHAKAFLIRRTAAQTLATYDLLQRFDEHYTRLRRQQGLLLFSDLTHKLARQMPQLGDGLCEDIYFRLDGRVTHLLLDEFQDTSLAQWDVLSPIAREIAATGTNERSVFVVGDAKQAIYGWRGGVAELFDEIESQLMLEKENVETMNLSYRSSAVVLSVVNQVFARLDQAPALQRDAETAIRWQRSFQAHASARDLSGYVTLETSAYGADMDDDAGVTDGDVEVISAISDAHERYVAQRVKALYERPGGAGSIGVLVSTNDAASKLIHQIGVLGLPVSGEGGGWLTDSPAVSAVLSALVMADHPGDTAAVFHVLNSPLADVVGLASFDDKRHVQRVAMTLRKTLLTRGYAQTLADWTRQLAPHCDARGLTRLTQLIQLADQFDDGDALRPSRFVALAESRRVAEPSPAAIRVMTIHGSKGLEFDTVVLAELDKWFSDRTPLVIERAHPTAPIQGVYRNPAKDVRALDARLERAFALHRGSRLMDWLCALYVGMTRAKQALHMIVRPASQKQDGSPGSRGLSFAAVLVQALAEVDTHEAGRVLFEAGDAGWACAAAKPQALPVDEIETVGVIEWVGASRRTRRFWPTVSPSARAGGERSAGALLDISNDSAEAKRYGTLVHAWMERVGFIDEDATPGEAELRKIATRCMSAMDDNWLTERVAWFGRLLAGENAGTMLSRNGASELWRERRFMVQDGKELLRGCFDRITIWRDAGGRVTRVALLDFKTDRVEPDSAGETLGVTSLLGHYLPQMRAYRRALTRMLRIDAASIRMRLWFVGADVVAELPD